jgi:hypothetical protein
MSVTHLATCTCPRLLLYPYLLCLAACVASRPLALVALLCTAAGKLRGSCPLARLLLSVASMLFAAASPCGAACVAACRLLPLQAALALPHCLPLHACSACRSLLLHVAAACRCMVVTAPSPQPTINVRAFDSKPRRPCHLERRSTLDATGSCSKPRRTLPLSRCDRSEHDTSSRRTRLSMCSRVLCSTPLKGTDSLSSRQQ